MAKNKPENNKNSFPRSSVGTMNGSPLLDLTTQREYKTVAIDGVKYTLASMEDMSIMEQARFQGYGNALARVSQHRGRFTEAVEKEYNKVLYDFIKMILPGIEGKVVGKLTIWQRIRVVEVFMMEANLLGTAKVAPKEGAYSAAPAGKSPKVKK